MARRLGSGYKFNTEKAEKYAAKGLKNEQIAGKFGVSKATFLRCKREVQDLNEAIERGRKAYAASLGREVRLIAGGLRIVTVDHVPQVRGEQVENRTDLVFAHLLANPGEGFYAITRKTRLSADEVSDAMVNLILERGVVRAVRDERENFRYFVSPTAPTTEPIAPNGTSIHQLNRNKATGISHQTAQWQAAY